LVGKDFFQKKKSFLGRRSSVTSRMAKKGTFGKGGGKRKQTFKGKIPENPNKKRGS